jgi:hypothetical protein
VFQGGQCNFVISWGNNKDEKFESIEVGSSERHKMRKASPL